MRILLATDGSPGAQAAAAFLGALRLSPEDRICLVAVEPTGHGPTEEVFASTRQALGSGPGQIETVRRSGRAWEQVIEAARTWNADLVALGATGTTGVTRMIMGSVAQRVLRHADRPVIVARPVRHGLRRVLVGIDATQESRQAAEWAARLPLPAGTEVRLMSALPPPEAVTGVAPSGWAESARFLNEVLEAARTEAERRLRDVAWLIQNSEHPVAAETVRGDVALSLVTAAEREEVDLIVLAAQPEAVVARLLLGTVSEQVARDAPCSVLVVR